MVSPSGCQTGGRRPGCAAWQLLIVLSHQIKRQQPSADTTVQPQQQQQPSRKRQKLRACDRARASPPKYGAVHSGLRPYLSVVSRTYTLDPNAESNSELANRTSPCIGICCVLGDCKQQLAGKLSLLEPLLNPRPRTQQLQSSSAGRRHGHSVTLHSAQQPKRNPWAGHAAAAARRGWGCKGAGPTRACNHAALQNHPHSKPNEPALSHQAQLLMAQQHAARPGCMAATKPRQVMMITT